MSEVIVGLYGDLDLELKFEDIQEEFVWSWCVWAEMIAWNNNEKFIIMLFYHSVSNC